ncbi:MAG: O-antigen ligase family protein, partial [Chloroflexota bacterium]
MINFSRSRLTDFYYQIPSSPLIIGMILAVVGSLSGIILAFGGPLVGLGLIIAIVSGLIVLSNMEVGIWAVIGVVTLLPFATLPFKIVITPTFLDLALGGVFAVWVLRLVTGRQREVVAGPVAFPLIIFILVMLFAFVFGMPNGPLTSQLLRKFAELLLSLVFVILLIDYCRRWADLQRLTFVVMLAGTAAAIIGIVFWALPDELANEILNMLTRIGYPGGFVIRYVEDNPEALERAIGTSVDPNVYGGMLVLMGTLIAPQLVAEKPLFWGRRWVSWAAFLSIFVALLLTNSRGAFIGLVASVGFLAFVRYRQLLPWGTAALAVILLFILPTTQDAITTVVRFAAGESTADIATAYTERLTDAFEGEDLATQMR